MSSRAIAVFVGCVAVAAVVAIGLSMRLPSRGARGERGAAVVVEGVHDNQDGSPVRDESTAATRVEEAASIAKPAISTRLSLEGAVASGVAALTPSDPDGFEVRVVRRDDQRPASDAIVAAVDIGVLVRQRASIEAIAGDLRRFVGGMLLVRADGDGVARLPRRFFQMMLIAEQGELRGATGALGSETGPNQIELSPPTTVRVQVFDAEGRPKSGVIVKLEHSHAETRAPDGIATFSDLELDGYLWTLTQRPDGLWLELEAPLVHGPTARVDLRHPPIEPVPLRVGGCGSLVVRVVDAERRLVPAVGSADLEWIDAARQDEPAVEFALDRGGETTLPCVEPGCRFKLTTTLLERDETSVEIVGPRSAGDVATVEVPLPSEHVVLVGRAVDGAGRPVAASCVSGRLSIVSSTNAIEERDLLGRLDVHSSFRIDWNDRGIDPAARPVSIRWRSRFGPPTLESRELPFPALPARGVVELGDVVFDTPPLLAHGRVVDDRGRPLMQAFVATTWSDSSKPRLRPGSDSTSGSDGTFELRGFEAAEELLASASSIDGHSEDLPLPRDGSELRLVIPRRGDVEGRLRAVPDEFRGWLSLELRDREHLEIGSLTSKDLASDGSFRFKNLVPGTYDLEVSLEGDGHFGEVLQRVERVVVAPGESMRDPRLLDLDPWAHVHFAEVHVELADGEAVAGVEATTLSDGTASSWIVEQPGAVARVPTTHDRVDVAVRVDGYRPVVVPAVADRADVTLQPSFRVRLVLGPLPPELSGKSPIQLSIVCKDRRLPKEWTRVERVLREGQDWMVSFPSAGTYVGRIGFKVDPSDHELDMVPIAPFVVDDSSDEQSRTLIVEPKRDEH